MAPLRWIRPRTLDGGIVISLSHVMLWVSQTRAGSDLLRNLDVRQRVAFTKISVNSHGRLTV